MKSRLSQSVTYEDTEAFWAAIKRDHGRPTSGSDKTGAAGIKQTYKNLKKLVKNKKDTEERSSPALASDEELFLRRRGEGTPRRETPVRVIVDGVHSVGWVVRVQLFFVPRS